MPISYHNRILFIHIPKNAGKSIETAIGAPAKNKKRTLINRFATLLLRITQNQNVINELTGMYDVSLYGPHMTLREILALNAVSADDFVRLTKIAVCRNPYDRAVSIFKHWGAGYHETPDGIRAFWQEWPKQKFSGLRSHHNRSAFLREQWEFCVDLDGKMAIDHLLRYEDLEEDFYRVSRDLGLGMSRLPWIGVNRRTRDYLYLYDEASKEIIQEMFDRDFSFFGYRQMLNN